MKRLLLTLAGVLLVSHAPSVQATILLNEIHLRTPPTSDTVPADGNHEFIELKSDSPQGQEVATNLWILVIENDGGGVGEVKQAWALRNEEGAWMSTGPNGLLLIGDDFDRDDAPYQFIKAPQTAVGDPDGMGPDDLEDANAVSILLVRRDTVPVPDPLTAAVNADVDVDDDGALDWTEAVPPANRQFTSAPWSAIIDSVGYNGDQGDTIIKPPYSLANLSRANSVGVPQVNTGATNFLPHTLARSGTDNTANSRTAWYGGKVGGSSVDSLVYGANYFNHLPGATWTGFVTPGQPNLSSAPLTPKFLINELNLHPQGNPGKSPDPANPAQTVRNDGNFEYVEIINTEPTQAGGSNFAGSLASYTLLVVDSGGITLGKIREAWTLNKFATGSNGLLVLGDDYPGGYSPFQGSFDPATQFADPSEVPAPSPDTRLLFSSMGRGDLTNNGVTIFLVRNFTGFVDDDIDSNDDGVLNATLPFTIVDSVSVPEVKDDGTLFPGHGGYSPAKPDIAVGATHETADNLSRLPGIVAAESTAAWSAGVLGSRSPYGLSYKNGHSITGSGTAFSGAASPGRPNYSSAAPPPAGTFLLNEVHINPPTATDLTEYVEVISTAPHALMRDLWLIVLEATSNGSGLVKNVIDLRGQATGGNRLAIFADGIEESGELVKFVSGQTFREDPESFNADGTANTAQGFNFGTNNFPDNGISVLLVSYTATTSAPVPATPNSDLDTDNDGTLNSTPPWTLIDGISTGNGVGGVPTVTTTGFSPGNISRYAGDTRANLADAWFGGELTGGTATSFDYGSNYFGTFKGAASPGRHNVTATPDNTTTLLLNEININPPGGDNDKEFVELRSANGSAISAAGYSILLLDNDGADTGRVLEVWDLDSASTGTNGLLLAGVGYDTSVPWTEPADAPNALTKLFAPETMENDDIGLNTDNGALTVVLVKNFTGRVGDDLDEGTQDNLTVADDHVLNTPLPWTQMADSVSMKGFTVVVDGVNTTYVNEGYILFSPAADLTVPIPPAPNQANGYTPDTVARFDGNVAANSTAAWYGANLFGTAGTSTAYDPVQFFPSTLSAPRKVTPGSANIQALTGSSDPDGDGVSNLMEEALGMNPNKADNYNLPQPTMRNVNGILQPAFVFKTPIGGAPGVVYTVQASFSMTSWNTPTVLHSTVPDPGGGFETLTYLLDPDQLDLFLLRKKVFFRLKVQRP